MVEIMFELGADFLFIFCLPVAFMHLEK
jgi:hypothetical protein